jgi:hypothetical protein
LDLETVVRQVTRGNSVLRSVLGTTATTVALLMAVAPGAAQAVQPAPPDPLTGYQLHPEWGSITGTTGVLRRGCRSYTYSYSVTPPEGIWAIEVYISGPGFKHLAAGAFLDGYDPQAGAGHYKLCRATTRYGRFKIQAKLSVDDGAGHITEGALPSDTYKLGRPHKHHR